MMHFHLVKKPKGDVSLLIMQFFGTFRILGTVEKSPVKPALKDHAKTEGYHKHRLGELKLPVRIFTSTINSLNFLRMINP